MPLCLARYDAGGQPSPACESGIASGVGVAPVTARLVSTCRYRVRATQTRLNSAKAALDGAQATLDVARAELRKMQMRAPFRGRFEKRNAEVGQFMNPGSSCGTVVQLDPIVFVTQANEKQAGQIVVDGNARIRLSDGQEVSGKVSYLARVADPATRQFRVEISVANPKGQITVGRTAEIKIEIGSAITTVAIGTMNAYA